MNFAGFTSSKDVLNDETKTNPFRILVADNDRSVLKLYWEALSCVNSHSYGSGSNPPEKGNPDCINTFKLTPQSFDVVTCQRADEAVEAVKDSLEHGRPFSVVFTDIRMPPLPDGIWAAEQIRALDENIEIVMVTGHTNIHPRVISCRVLPAHKLLFIQNPLQSCEVIQFAFSLSMKWYAECELKKVRKKLEASVEKKTKDLKKVNEKLDGIINSITDHMGMIDRGL